MIYDEGFSVELENLKFFSFNFYSIQKNNTQNNNIININSHCYQTLVGWYLTRDKKKWGCFKGYKNNVENINHIHSIKYNKKGNDLFIVDPTFIEHEKLILLNKPSNKQHNGNFRNIRFKSSKFLEQNLINEKFNIQKTNKNLVEKINNVAKTWKAELYTQFKDKSFEELNEFAGIERNGKNSYFTNLNKFNRFVERE